MAAILSRGGGVGVGCVCVGDELRLSDNKCASEMDVDISGPITHPQPNMFRSMVSEERHGQNVDHWVSHMSHTFRYLRRATGTNIPVCYYHVIIILYSL